MGKIPPTGSFSSASSSAGYIYHRKKDYKDFANLSTSSIPITTSSALSNSFSNHRDITNTSSIPVNTSSFSRSKYRNPSTYNVTPDLLPFGNNYSSQTNTYTPRNTKFPFTPIKQYETPLHQQAPHISWSSNNIGTSNNESKNNPAERIEKSDES